MLPNEFVICILSLDWVSTDVLCLHPGQDCKIGLWRRGRS